MGSKAGRGDASISSKERGMKRMMAIAELTMLTSIKMFLSIDECK
jgi:hypothetical protein